MREIFQEVVRHEFLNLDYIQGATIDVLGRIRNDLKFPRLGYVAGIMYSDGPEFVDRNIERLLTRTEILRQTHNIPMFCSPEIFTPQINFELPEMKLPHEEREQLFYDFWRRILQSGHVTDIFMTEGWRRSRGSNVEYQTAQVERLTIHDLDITR